MKQIDKLILLTVLLGVLASCVTQKRRGEVSGLGKLYHNITAKYNGYFNANELLEASMLTLEEQHQDNFKQVLPVYEYVDAANPDAVAADLDKAIEKVSVVVNLHRVSHWTDDCYLLLGQAQYLKQDYESAEETLRYLVSEFSPEKMAAREKKSRKKSGKKSKGKEEDRADRADADEDEVDITELSEKEQRRLLRQQEKERKRYNRELKKQRKREQRARKKARKRARKNRKKGEEVKLPSPELEESGEGGEEKDSAVAGAEEEKEAEEEKDDEKAGPSDKEEEAEEPAPQPDNYFLKHRPVYQEGVLWLARTYTERAMYDRAMRLILQLEADPKTFDDIRQELAVVKAHHFLRQEEYDRALEPLEEAIASANKRQDKARYAFIIAQLHQRAGRRSEALASFERALKYGPDYDMEFSGRLYIVENGWRSGSIGTEEARDRLNKMLKDSKNLEYQDQIYYTLAEIELESGNRKEGIALLEKSLSNSSQNTLQRAESYLRLADLYLEEEDFVPAQKYFDSTLTVLPKNDDRYPEVERWRNNLTDIAANLETIAYQDSLLRIARLSETEKRELAYAIKKKRDEERLQQITANAGSPEESRGLSNGSPPGSNVSLTPGSGRLGNPESNFFAYDDRAVKRGKKEFFREWGDRPLEDNWRRSSKSGGSDLPVAATEAAAPAEVLPEDEINQILAEVPGSDSEILEAELKLQEAMYKLGALYRDRLGNHDKSIEVLEELNRRFDRSSYQLDSWYYLYLDFKDIGKQQQAEAYAKQILERYPTSTYAKVISNPNYARELAEEENKLNRFYNEAYAAFTSGNYQAAYQKSLEAPRVFGAQNPMQSKFALLSAMSTGNLQGKDAYVNALRDLIARYPDTPEQKRAREILRLLGAGQSGLPGGAQVANTQFQVNDDQLHYILIVFNEDISLNESKIKVSNYHLQYHKLDKLRVTNIYLGTDAETRLPILVVRRFKDKAEAMNYYNGIQRNQGDFIDSSVDHEIFAVSQNNYREILRSKSLNGYGDFFAQHYLQ